MKIENLKKGESVEILRILGKIVLKISKIFSTNTTFFQFSYRPPEAQKAPEVVRKPIKIRSEIRVLAEKLVTDSISSALQIVQNDSPSLGCQRSISYIGDFHCFGVRNSRTAQNFSKHFLPIYCDVLRRRF